MYHHRDFHYYLSIEEEEDNRKNYHYAIRLTSAMRDQVLLQQDPYGDMAQQDFERLVDDLYATTPFHL